MSATNMEVVGETRVELTPGCSLVGKLTRLTQPDLNVEKFDVRNVHSFLGIPYAKTPVGDLMFKDPVPAEPWEGEKSAKEFGPACPQNLIVHQMTPFKFEMPTSMSLDCLHLNVWTPNTSRDAKLPVMVWFYGGGYFSGYTDMYRGDVLANFHDVVIVTVGYRVGVWGFLCTEDSAATGNYGLLDQIESLKWVKKHITSFGGDPENVTIFGESAGAVSTAYLMLSPAARGLFKQAISESGTVLTLGESRTPSEAWEKLKVYLKHFGCEATNGNEIITFLKAQPPEKIVMPMEMLKLMPFAPVIDGKVVTGRSSDMLFSEKLAKINHMIGVNRDEGAFTVLGLQMMGQDISKLDKETAKGLVEDALQYRFGGKDTNGVVDVILEIYLKDADTVDQIISAVMEFAGDINFGAPSVQTADAQSASSKVYFYSFQKRNAFVKLPEFVKADHGCEVPSVFGLPFLFPHVEFSAEDRALCRKMMSYWTNFAKTGNPNCQELEEWPEYTAAEKKYIVLDDPIHQDTMLDSRKVLALNEALSKYIK